VRALVPPLGAGLVLAVFGFVLGARNGWTLAALLFGGYTAYVTLGEMLLPIRQRMKTQGEGLWEAFQKAQARGRRRFGAYVVHAGALVVVMAIAVSSTGGRSKEVLLRQGESVSLGAYDLTFAGADRVTEPHRQSIRARLDIRRNGHEIGTLYPRMSYYESQREPIGTPAVHSSFSEDLYLSVHNVDPDAGTVALLVLVNPMVGWIWIATFVMALGGLLALLPARRAMAEARARLPAAAAGMEGAP